MYRRLLDICYTTEKPLVKDERQLFRLTRASTEQHREAMLTVLHEFFDETEDGWISRRAMVEIEAMREKQQKQRDKANAMWEKRRNAAGTSTPPAHGNAPALPRHPEKHAAASKVDADAMPPTPTPTPTPVINTRAVGPDLPGWIPKESWAGYVEMRRKIKKPMTDRAMQLRINDLEKFKDAGHDLAAILDQSTASSWTDLYAPKGRDLPSKSRQMDWAAKPDWVSKAGFEDVADANASRCFAHNADQFQNGKRIEVSA